MEKWNFEDCRDDYIINNNEKIKNDINNIIWNDKLIINDDFIIKMRILKQYTNYNRDLSVLLKMYNQTDDINVITDAYHNKGWGFLHIAILTKNKEIFDYLLEQKTINVDLNHSGYTPLYFAIRENDEYFIEKLIAKGANVNILLHDTRSYIVDPIIKYNLNIIKMLINANIEYDTYSILSDFFKSIEWYDLIPHGRDYGNENRFLFENFKESINDTADVNVLIPCYHPVNKLSLLEFAKINSMRKLILLLELPNNISTEKFKKVLDKKFETLIENMIYLLKNLSDKKVYWNIRSLKKFIKTHEEYNFLDFDKLYSGEYIDKNDNISENLKILKNALNFHRFLTSVTSNNN